MLSFTLEFVSAQCSVTFCNHLAQQGSHPVLTVLYYYINMWLWFVDTGSSQMKFQVCSLRKAGSMTALTTDSAITGKTTQTLLMRTTVPGVCISISYLSCSRLSFLCHFFSLAKFLYHLLNSIWVRWEDVKCLEKGRKLNIWLPALCWYRHSVKRWKTWVLGYLGIIFIQVVFRLCSLGVSL